MVASFGNVDETLDAETLIVLPKDEIDNAADGIGAVDCGRPFLEHLDTVDRGERDLIDVDGRALKPVRGNPAAVEQDERRARALPAQIGKGRAVVATLLAGDDVDVAREIVPCGSVGGQVTNELLRAGDRVALELLGRDDLQR